MSMRPYSWLTRLRDSSPRLWCRSPLFSSPIKVERMQTNKPIASLSLDLDNQWSYMKTHGDPGWDSFPSYLDILIPRVLHFLQEWNLTITFFIVGQDAV